MALPDSWPGPRPYGGSGRIGAGELVMIDRASWRRTLSARLAGAWAIALLGLGGAQAQTRAPCGMSPQDWCPAPPRDLCGMHHDAASCHADRRCTAMPYRGES